MNKQQYKKYQHNVENFLKVNNVKAGCYSPINDNSEGYFSWQQCDCCGSQLGGTREDYSFATNTNEIFNASICIDCVYYLAYGQLNDMTMMEME